MALRLATSFLNQINEYINFQKLLLSLFCSFFNSENNHPADVRQRISSEQASGSDSFQFHIQNGGNT